MKKAKYIALSSVALLLAGCASDDVLSTAQEDANAIVFNANSNVTRGTKVPESNFYTNGFSVYANAMKNGQPTPIMENTKVTQSTSSTTGWEYKPIVYWPNDGSTVDFYGIYQQNFDDRNVLLSYGYDKRPRITYIVPQNIDDHKDILWAPPVLNATSATGTVNFNFQHILTAVSMQVTDNKDGLVRSLRLMGNNNSTSTLYKVFANETYSEPGFGNIIDMLEGGDINNLMVESIELTGDFPTHGIINPLETDPTEAWKMSHDETRTYTLSRSENLEQVTGNPLVTKNNESSTLFLLPSKETLITVNVTYSFHLDRIIGTTPTYSGDYRFTTTKTVNVTLEAGKDLSLNVKYSTSTETPYYSSLSSLVKL